MERAFGEFLARFKQPEVEEGQEEAVCQNGNYVDKVPIADVIKEGTTYVGVLFTAHYCPPCTRFCEPLKAFYEEFSKDDKFALIVVNCDKREKEYAECIKDLPWPAIPYHCTELAEKLEDKAEASTLPKLAVFSVDKGFSSCLMKDIKNIVLKSIPPSEQVDMAEQRLAEALETFQPVEEENEQPEEVNEE